MRVRGKNKWIIILFLLPALAVYIFWVMNPVIQAGYMSTLKWVTLNQTRFAGVDNYVNVFHSDMFWKSMKNSMIYMVISTSVQVVLGFFYGYLVYMQPKGYRIYKMFLFVPTILPTVAVGFIWTYIYSPGMGVLMPVMEALGIGKYYISPISVPTLAMMAVIVAHTWNQVGVQIILFNSGFMNIPHEVIECACLDGAVGWKMIRTMIIPLSWDITKMIIILQTISALRSFDLIYVMTGGGPNHATEVLPMHLFVSAFQNFNMGYANVVAVVIFVLAMTITMVMRRILRRESIY